MSSRNLAQSLVKQLADNGVKRIYGLVGDSLNPVSDALRKDGRINFIQVRNEEAAAFAAGAEAQLTGELAVCAGTSGPGNLHLINGLYDANRSYAPVLAICSHIPSSQIGTGYFQETHPDKLFAECSRYCELVSNAEHFPHTLKLAIQNAITKEGVAAIAIPGDLGTKPVSGDGIANAASYKNSISTPNADSVKALADAINKAKKITLFCGHGCKDAHKEVLELSNKIKAPICCTLRGKQWMGAENPNYIGLTGLIGYGSASSSMEASELLIMIGTDFPYQPWIPTKPQKAQIDIRAEHIGKRTKIDFGVVGDTATTIKSLLKLLKEKEDSSFLDKAVKAYKKSRADLDVYVKNVSCQEKPHPEYATALIDKFASDSAIFTIPTGLGTVWGARYITPKKDRRIIGSFLHGSMANEIPMAIGAQFAYPERQVVAICGDGGLTMLLGELLTVAQYDLPIKMFVYNNETLGFIDLEMMAAGYTPYKTKMKNPNFAKMAESMGIKGIRIDENCELSAGIKEAFTHKGPVLVDIATDPNAIALPPKISLEQSLNFSLALSKLALSGNISDAIKVISSNKKTLGTLL